MPRVLNKSSRRAVSPSEDGLPPVYIGRPSEWGNPFRIGVDGTREEVIEKYRTWLLGQPELVARVKRLLRGRDLLCSCKPKACHGDVLLEIANQREDES